MAGFKESTLPVPGEYDDWRSWAASLVRALEESSSEVVINFPIWKYDSTKPRDGLPAAVDGDLIRVLDGEGNERFWWWSDADDQWHQLGD